MKLTINKRSQPKQVSTKFGIKQSFGIQTMEYGDKWLNGFVDANSATWQEGDIVEADVSQNGEYLNFKGQSKGTNQSYSPNIPNIQPEPYNQPQNQAYNQAPQPPTVNLPMPPQNRSYVAPVAPQAKPEVDWDKINKEKSDQIKQLNAIKSACTLWQGKEWTEEQVSATIDFLYKYQTVSIEPIEEEVEDFGNIPF